MSKKINHVLIANISHPVAVVEKTELSDAEKKMVALLAKIFVDNVMAKAHESQNQTPVPENQDTATAPPAYQ